MIKPPQIIIDLLVNREFLKLAMLFRDRQFFKLDVIRRARLQETSSHQSGESHFHNDPELERHSLTFAHIVCADMDRQSL